MFCLGSSAVRSPLPVACAHGDQQRPCDLRLQQVAPQERGEGEEGEEGLRIGGEGDGAAQGEGGGQGTGSKQEEERGKEKKEEVKEMCCEL